MPADRVSQGQPRQPKYRLHKPTGRAVVTLNGKDHYLGVFGSPESHEAYRRKIAEWFAAGGPERLPASSGRELSICDLAQAYWRSLEQREAEKVACGAHDRVKLALETVENLRRGEFGVCEGRKVLPVAEQHVWKILRQVSRQVAAMIELMWWSGMRPGEGPPASALRPRAREQAVDVPAEEAQDRASRQGPRDPTRTTSSGSGAPLARSRAVTSG